jgi:myo-inositol-1-phosphate synthase
MIGVLVVGAGGSTASTLIAGARAMANGLVEEQYGITGVSPLSDLPLRGATEIVWGGWEIGPRSLLQAVQQHAILPRHFIQSMHDADLDLSFWPAYLTDRDFAVVTEGVAATTDSSDSIIAAIREDIRHFRTLYAVDTIVLVNLSNPPSTELTSLSSASLYARAGVEEGCHFVEFTPSPTIDDSLCALARSTGAGLAGRDGSTGQTMIKVALAHLFTSRNLQIGSWYSTNLIGNHDGTVLTDYRFSKWKLEDKTQALTHYLEPDSPHTVRIDFMPDRGDQKEAWDSVRLLGWLGSKHQLSLHWIGGDSFLASPLVLDLVRLLDYGSRCLGKPPGVQEALGAFFKSPIGRENSSWPDLYQELLTGYC